jgi:acetyl-CoA C-acetyltransferase
MREAVIVSYARTGLAKSGRGGFNITPPMSMAAHAIKHAVARAGVDKDYVEDCYLGNCAHGAPNIGRQAALLAGMPKSTAGVSVNRFCSSGLQTIAMAANSIRRRRLHRGRRRRKHLDPGRRLAQGIDRS